MKKVDSSNMSNAVLNRAWTSGKYYNMYRHDYGTGVFGKNETTGAPLEILDLADANYYVVSSNYVVYMCVGVGSGYSQEDPSSGLTYDATNKFISELTDGYRWKLISKPSTADIVKFKTTAYHPVITLTTAPPGGSDYEFQWNAQANSAANAGAVYTIIPNDGGTGYGTSTSGIPVTVKGDGTGLVVTAESNGAGAIVKYNISSYGTGYSWCQLTVGGAGNGATATAIISPLKGLGADPVQDLLGHNVVINTRFEYADGGAFTVVNNFRRLGLVLNPTQYGSPNTLYTGATASVMQTLVVTTANNIVPDSIIQDNTTFARGIVVDVLDGTGADAGRKLVRIIRTKDENSLSTNPSANFAETNTVSPATGLPNAINPTQAVKPVEPSAPKNALKGLKLGSTFCNSLTGAALTSSQLILPTTQSPT
jgi:hypothetical protein